MPSTGYINSNKRSVFFQRAMYVAPYHGLWNAQINKSLYLSVIKRYMLEKHMERIKHHIWEIRDALI